MNVISTLQYLTFEVEDKSIEAKLGFLSLTLCLTVSISYSQETVSVLSPPVTLISYRADRTLSSCHPVAWNTTTPHSRTSIICDVNTNLRQPNRKSYQGHLTERTIVNKSPIHRMYNWTLTRAESWRLPHQKHSCLAQSWYYHDQPGAGLTW
jgi:hypothetical protein